MKIYLEIGDNWYHYPPLNVQYHFFLVKYRYIDSSDLYLYSVFFPTRKLLPIMNRWKIDPQLRFEWTHNSHSSTIIDFYLNSLLFFSTLNWKQKLESKSTTFRTSIFDATPNWPLKLFYFSTTISYSLYLLCFVNVKIDWPREKNKIQKRFLRLSGNIGSDKGNSYPPSTLINAKEGSENDFEISKAAKHVI